MSVPLVSISCITFNHAPFLRECFDSFLMQKTNFDFEVIVHDDASTDETQEIIKEYSERYPSIFFPMYQIKNQYSEGVRGMMARFNFPRCRGKYIALCEGDDYWSDPQKLQKQVDFLEANEDFSICYHAVEEITETGIETNILESYTAEREFSIEDLCQGNFIHTPSVVFKNNIVEFPAFFHFSPLGDYPLHMLNAQYGKIKYFPDKMAVYRVGIGVWSNLQISDRIINTMFAVHLLKIYFTEQDKKIVELLEAQYDSLFKRLMGVNNDEEQIIGSFLHNIKDVEIRLTVKDLLKLTLIKLERKINLS